MNINTEEFNKIMPCISELSNLKRLQKDRLKKQVIACLSNYGDIYRQTYIDLYTNPKTNETYFPDNQRIQASLNTFLHDIELNSVSPKLDNEQQHILTLYNILLNDTLRNIYNNEVYPDYKQNGGKKNKSKKNKSNKKNKSKKNKSRRRKSKRN